MSDKVDKQKLRGYLNRQIEIFKSWQKNNGSIMCKYYNREEEVLARIKGKLDAGDFDEEA